MKEIKTKIDNFYKVEISNDKYIKLNDKFIPAINCGKPIVFTFGNKDIKTVQDAKKDSNCIVISQQEFYMKYFNLSEEDYL
jgi:hypothetical protein